MIKYTLICDIGHEFEAWFSKGSDFDDQAARGLLQCAHCSSQNIEKAIMAPAVVTSRQKSARNTKAAAGLKLMTEMAAKIRDDIEKNCDDVGDKFADEARAMHYGEKPERAIYGQAAPEEARSLTDEGIDIAPLLDAVVPKNKKTLN